jgi:hypothetical protein
VRVFVKNLVTINHFNYLQRNLNEEEKNTIIERRSKNA